MDKAKTEVAWIFASERPRAESKRKAQKRELRWEEGDVHRKFDLNAKPTRWLGFFVDPRLNWRAHVAHRVALGFHRLRTLARVMNANGVP